jgi:hypothetical protein
MAGVKKIDRAKGKSPYVRYGKEPYKYQFRSCSHRRNDGRVNARYEQSENFAGDVCMVCNIILRNFAERRHERAAA